MIQNIKSVPATGKLALSCQNLIKSDAGITVGNEVAIASESVDVAAVTIWHWKHESQLACPKYVPNLVKL